MSRSVEKDENFYRLTAFRQRENYISTISHDLKIPVIAQMRALELLSDGSLGTLNPEQKEMIDLTLESCKSVYDMLSAILETYKYENKKIPLIFSVFNAEKMFNNIFYKLKPLLKRKNININLNLKTPEIFGDEKNLEKAFKNIFEYCLYSAVQNSTINVNLNKISDGFEILINCQTHFDENFPDNLKGNFEKIGSNLNLCLAKQIIDSHNGNIVFQNNNKNLLINIKFNTIIP